MTEPFSTDIKNTLSDQVLFPIAWIILILQVLPFAIFTPMPERWYWVGVGMIGAAGTLGAWWLRRQKGDQPLLLTGLIVLLGAVFLGAMVLGGSLSVMGLTVYVMLLTLLSYLLTPHKLLIFALGSAVISGIIFVLQEEGQEAVTLILEREMRLLMLLDAYVILTAIIYLITRNQATLKLTAEYQQQQILSETAVRRTLETRMTQLLNALPVVLIVFDREKRLISAEGKGLGDTDMKQMIGKSLDDLPIREHIAADVDHALDGATFDVMWPHHTGHYYHSFYYPVINEGAVGEVLVITMDVSERIRVASKLMLSEARFKQLTEQAPYTIVIEEASTNRILYSNTVRIADYNLEAGMNLYDWFMQRVLPAHHDKLATIWPTAQTSETTAAEIPLVNIDTGETLWVACRAAVLEREADHSPTAHVWYLADITERKRNEQAIASSADQLQTIFEEALDIIIIVDEAHQIRRLNSSVTTILGYEDPAALIGTSFNDLLVSDIDNLLDDRQDEKFTLWKAIPIRRADGSICPMEITATLLPWEGSTSIMLTLRDLTTRIRIEEEMKAARQLQETARQQAELLEAQQNILFTIAHQLRNPLAVIQLSTEFMQRYGNRIQPDQRETHLAKVLTHTRQLTRMMEDMLAARSALDGSLPFKPAPGDFCALCERLFFEAQSSHLVDQHTFRLKNSIEHCQAMIDDSLIIYVLDNLLGNAIRYSPEGGLIEMVMAEDGDQFVVMVRDEGIGIPAEAQEHIFDMFYRADNTQAIKGTGIGLGLAKRSAIAHGGELTVTSEQGRGTTFTLRLPIIPILG